MLAVVISVLRRSRVLLNLYLTVTILGQKASASSRTKKTLFAFLQEIVLLQT